MLGSLVNFKSRALICVLIQWIDIIALCLRPGYDHRLLILQAVYEAVPRETGTCTRLYGITAESIPRRRHPLL